MSPLQAMERSYSTLKSLLREGAYAPGARLEANRIADELGVSMTPVRDVLHRLVGERLVEASSGEGFHVPRYSEVALRDLYEWHSALVLMSIRTARPPIGTMDEESGLPAASLADRTSQLFLRLAAMAPNREIGAAVAGAGNRLHPFRLIEARALALLDGELEELEVRNAGQPAAVRRYHLRRMKAVPQLLAIRNAEEPTVRL